MTFIEKLEYLIELHKYNWRSFSNAIGIPYTTVMSWRDVDSDNIKLKTARQISDFFNVSLDYWFSDNAETETFVSNGASTFGDNLKNIRIKKGMSQEELANLMGYKSGKSAISRIENGHNGVSQSTVIKLCDVLNVSPDELLGSSKRTISEHEELLIQKYRELSEDAQELIDKSLGIIKKTGKEESIKQAN